MVLQYELDSLCGFLKLSRTYYQNTNNTNFMNANCTSVPPEKLLGLTNYIGRAAVDQIFRVINEQSQPTFDEDFNLISFYNWTGQAGALSPMVDNGGNGEPKAFTGLVGTHHRPSDDLSVFGMDFFCAAGKPEQMHLFQPF